MLPDNMYSMFMLELLQFLDLEITKRLKICVACFIWSQKSFAEKRGTPVVKHLSQIGNVVMFVRKVVDYLF